MSVQNTQPKTVDILHAKPKASRWQQTLLKGWTLLLLCATSLISHTASAGNLELGKPAPPLVLTTLSGQQVATQDLLGDVVIVTFWATWCAPCRQELAILSEYAEHHAQQGLRVLAFSLDGANELPQVRDIASKLSFPVGLLGSSWAGEYGRIWRVPVSFVIDRSGRLVDNGWKDPEPAWTAKRLARVVDPLFPHKD